MTALQATFLLTAVIILASAVKAVSSRRMLHAALWMIASLFGVAVLFAQLNANFFTVVQVVVYIGAIAILVIFAVMLTRRVMEDTGPQVIKNWWIALILVVTVFGGLVWLLSNWSGFQTSLPPLPGGDPTRDLGIAMVSPDGYIVPFEVSSVLLLTALIGSIFIGLEKK